MQAQIRVRGLLSHWPDRTHTQSSASVFNDTDESTLNRNAFEMPKARTLSLPFHGPESKVFSSQQHQGFHFLCPWLTNESKVFYLSYLHFSFFNICIIYVVDWLSTIIHFSFSFFSNQYFNCSNNPSVSYEENCFLFLPPLLKMLITFHLSSSQLLFLVNKTIVYHFCQLK